MGLRKFFNIYLVLPLGVLLQVVGYLESVYKITGVPFQFFVTSIGFVLVFSYLVWEIWFSHANLSPRTKKFAIGGLVAVSLLYYTFIQFYVGLQARNDVLATLVELESAISLVKPEPKEAEMQISRLIHKFGETPPLLNFRGRAYYEQGEYGKALDDFMAAEQGNPKNRDYEFNVAVAFREMCNYVQAQATFDHYVRSHPLDVGGHYNLGVVDQMLGEYPKALAEYAIVVKMNEQRLESALYNSGVAYALEFAEASDASRRKKDLESAIDYLERSTKIGGWGRIEKINKASVPLQERSPKCEGYYATDDLTALASTDQFKIWFQEKIKGGQPR